LNPFERGNEFGAALVELCGVVFGELVEETVAGGGEPEQDAAAVFGVGRAGEQASGLAALGELDDAVMAEAEAFGDIGDGGEGVGGGSGDLEEELVLLGGKAAGLQALLAFCRLHRSIVSRYFYAKNLWRVCGGR